jgi:hypothetical protein
MDGSFTVMEFDDPAPSIVYVEGLMGWIYIEQPRILHVTSVHSIACEIGH